MQTSQCKYRHAVVIDRGTREHELRLMKMKLAGFGRCRTSSCLCGEINSALSIRGDFVLASVAMACAAFFVQSLALLASGSAENTPQVSTLDSPEVCNQSDRSLSSAARAFSWCPRRGCVELLDITRAAIIIRVFASTRMTRARGGAGTFGRICTGTRSATLYCRHRSRSNV